MKKYVSFLPIFFLLIAFGCSEEAAPEKEPTKVEPKKSLIEREPEVREYFVVVDEMVDTYLTVAEDFLDNYDKMNAGEMEALDKLAALSEMSTSFMEIGALSEEFSKLEAKRTELEGVLDGEDVIEFGIMLADKMVRYNELVQRIDSTDFGNTTSLLDNLDFFN